MTQYSATYERYFHDIRRVEAEVKALEEEIATIKRSQHQPADTSMSFVPRSQIDASAVDWCKLAA